MLNEKEKLGIRWIVSKMLPNDLKSLASTITNHLVVIETVDDAINAILMYAPDAASVLGRRKVKKEHIFFYLHETGCTVSPQADKCTMVAATLKFWESKNAQGEQLSITEVEDDEMMLCEDQATSGYGIQNQSNSSEVLGHHSRSCDEVLQMAQQFVGWFYPILNNGHVAQVKQEDNFGPHHFWRDCQLKIHTPLYENLVEGASAASQKLLSLVGQHQLYFNPFDVPQQGIRGEVDAHGLVVVLVGGGLHRADHCIGIFEQKFGLVRDPSAANNWKIKFTELRLAGKDLDDLSEDCHAMVGYS